jgi:outer membrane protein OmpA-like peptidoglycan-associated protein
MKAIRGVFVAVAGVLATGPVAFAQTPPPAAPSPAAAAPAAPTVASAAAQAPAGLAVYFASGSSSLTSKEQATLDEAARVFNDGKPIVMIITGMADATGAPGPNLLLSQERADAVFKGLTARGLPPSRFQILAKGATGSLTGEQPQGADQAFRKVEITWR